MVILSVGVPPDPVSTFPSLDEARLFVQAKADDQRLKLVERRCDDGRVQFIVKAHETAGPDGFMALIQATVYEAMTCE